MRALFAVCKRIFLVASLSESVSGVKHTLDMSYALVATLEL